MRLNLVITVDVDNDGIATDDERTNLTWLGIERIPLIKELFNGFGLRATWFVRADEQLKREYGSAAFLLHARRKLWDELAASGDEIAWHPHVYKVTEEGTYVPEQDQEAFAQQLVQTRQTLMAEGFEHVSVRIGEASGSNRTMKTLTELGLKVDSSAIPGRKRADQGRTFDWEITPNRPYCPDLEDYRVQASGRGFPILEVPLTTMLFQAPYDPRPLLRYVNLSYHHPIFRMGVDTHLLGLGNDATELYITANIHPDEVLPRDTAHPLYAFSLEEVARNLDYLLRAIASKGVRLGSLRTMDVPRSIESETEGEASNAT